VLEFQEDPAREEYEDALLALACSLAKDADPNSNWVEKAGGLPDYICRVAKHIKEKGATTSSAIAQAISTIKRWIATGSPETKAKASAAIAQWEKMKASTKLTGLPIHEDMDLVMLTSGQSSGVEVNDDYLQYIANNENAAMLSAWCCGTGIPSGVLELANTFEEAEHPRHPDGRFRNAGAGAALDKAAAAASRAFSTVGKAQYKERPNGGLTYIGASFDKTKKAPKADPKSTPTSTDKPKGGGDAKPKAPIPPNTSLDENGNPLSTEQKDKEIRALDTNQRNLYYASTKAGYNHNQALRSAYSIWPNKDIYGYNGPDSLEGQQALLEANYEIERTPGTYYPSSVPGWLKKRFQGRDRVGPQRYSSEGGVPSAAAYNKSVGLDTGFSAEGNDPLLVTLSGKEPYGSVTYADPGYQSDGVKRYPLDSEGHCRAAWSYINMPKNASAYSPDQLAKIKAKIKRALAKYTKEEPVSASMGDSFLEAWDDRVELHGVASQPGYAFLHSPSPQVYSAAQRLYETGRRRGLDVTSAQAVIARLENADSYRRHIAAGGNRMMRTIEGQTVPVGKGSHDDIKSGGGLNKPISVPVLDLLEGADDLEGAQAKARDRALKALRDGDDQRAAEILDAANQDTPNKAFTDAIGRLGYESVPDGNEYDSFAEEDTDEPKEVDSYDKGPGSLLDKQPDKFAEPAQEAPQAAQASAEPQAKVKGRVSGEGPSKSPTAAPSTGGMSQPTGLDIGGGADSAAAAPVAASFLRQFSDNEVELAVRRVRDVAYWHAPKGTPIRAAQAAGGGAGPKASAAE